MLGHGNRCDYRRLWTRGENFDEVVSAQRLLARDLNAMPKILLQYAFFLAVERQCRRLMPKIFDALEP
jgi:hypothetical protein